MPQPRPLPWIPACDRTRARGRTVTRRSPAHRDRRDSARWRISHRDRSPGHLHIVQLDRISALARGAHQLTLTARVP